MVRGRVRGRGRVRVRVRPWRGGGETHMRCTGRKRRAAREALPTQRSSAARTASAASGSCMTCVVVSIAIVSMVAA